MKFTKSLLICTYVFASVQRQNRVQSVLFSPILQTFIFLNDISTYGIDSSNQDREFILACKRRVIQFVYKWVTTIRQPVFEDQSAVEFIEDLANELENDIVQYNALQEEASMMHHVMSQLRR